MFDYQEDSDSDQCIDIFRLFEGDNSHVQFVKKNPVMNIVCTSAKNTMKVNKDGDRQDVEVNIGVEELINATHERCSQFLTQTAFSCRTCRKIPAPIYFCQKCFKGSHHQTKNHDTQTIKLPAQLIGKLKCHCGDHICTMQSDWCADHSLKLLQINKEEQPILYQLMKQHIVDCFIILLQLQYESMSFASQFMASLYGEFKEKLEEDLQKLINFNQNHYCLIADCLSTRITIQQSKQNIKRPLILQLLKYKTLILENSVLKKIFQLNYSQITTITLNYLVSEYLKQQQSIVEGKQSQDQTAQTIKNLQTSLKTIISLQKDCSIIKQLAVDNIAPKKQHAFRKSHRHAVIKLYSLFSKTVIDAKVSTEHWAQLLTILDYHKLIYVQLVPMDYLLNFMLCATVQMKIFNKLMREVQDAIIKKDAIVAIFYFKVLVDISTILIKERNIQPKQLLPPQMCQQFLSIVEGTKNCIFKINLSTLKWKQKVTDLALFIHQYQQKPTNISKVTNEIYLNQQQNQVPIQNAQKQQIKINSMQTVNQKVVINETISESEHNKIQQTQIKLNKQENEIQKQVIQKQKQNVKTAQEIAIAKKKQKLKEKYSAMHTKVLQKAQVERLKSNEQNCSICREPNTKQKQLFMLGQIYQVSSNIFPLINFSHHNFSFCQHTFHVECLMKSRAERQCPLCKKAINTVFLPMGADMSEKGVVSFTQMIAVSSMFHKMNTYEVLPYFLEPLINQKLLDLVFDTNAQQQLPYDRQSIIKQTKRRQNQMVMNTTKQLYNYLSQANKQYVIKKLKETEEKLLETCNDANAKTIYKAVFLMMIIDLGHKREQNSQKLVEIVKQMQQDIKYQIIQKLVSQTLKTLQPSKQPKLNSNNQQSLSFISSVIPIPKYQALIFNQFKPVCKKYINHFESYWECLICQTRFCGQCQQSPDRHRRNHVTICVALMLATNKIEFIAQSNKKQFQIQTENKEMHHQLRPLDYNKLKSALRDIVFNVRS